MSTDGPGRAGEAGRVRLDPAALSALQRRRLREKLSAAQPALKGSDLVGWSLARLGFEWVTGIAGTPVDGVFRSAAGHGLRLLGTRSQAGAVMMAAAAAYVAGRLAGAVVVSAGPAVTNALTGILVARDNGWPLLVLGGRRALQGKGSGYFQELDAVPLMRPVTKWAACVGDAASIPAMLREAVQVACSGRPGPVYLDLPEDVLESTAVPPATLSPAEITRLPVGSEDLRSVLERLEQARRPVLVLGDGLRWGVNPDLIRPWVEAAGLPVVSLPLARGLVPESHPLAVRGDRWRTAVFGEADLMLVMGAGVDWRLRFGAEWRPGTEVVVVSSAPEDVNRVGSAALRVMADPADFLHRLAAQPASGVGGGVGARAGWASRVRELSAGVEACRPVAGEDGGRMSLAGLFKAVGAVLPEEAMVVLDGNLTLLAGQRLLSRQEPFRYLDPGWNGCMGTGIPFGMGARMAMPKRPVLVVTGDYAFGLAAIELETVARHALNLVVVVANNDGNTGAMRQANQLPAGHPERVHAFQEGLAYERVAEGLGIPACAVITPEELRQALEQAFRRGGSFLIQARIDPWSNPPAG